LTENFLHASDLRLVLEKNRRIEIWNFIRYDRFVYKFAFAGMNETSEAQEVRVRGICGTASAPCTAVAAPCRSR